MSSACILIVDDEAKLRTLLRDFFVKAGFDVLLAENGAQALDLFYAHTDRIDLIVLDVMMPVLNGWTTLARIRENSSVPVILLTAKSEDASQVEGFRLGADDYVAKPFSPVVLIARVQSLLKRVRGKEFSEVLTEGEITIEPLSRIVYLNADVLELTPKEYALLLYFVGHKNLALSRDKILDAVWSYDYFGDLRTVDTHVKQLRAKLKHCGNYIQTIRAVGYRFEVPR